MYRLLTLVVCLLVACEPMNGQQKKEDNVRSNPQDCCSCLIDTTLPNKGYDPSNPFPPNMSPVTCYVPEKATTNPAEQQECLEVFDQGKTPTVQDKNYCLAPDSCQQQCAGFF